MQKIVFSHSSANGTQFSGKTLDLSTHVNVKNEWDISNEQRNADFMEFGAWHCLQIRPKLNSFQGYDTVMYTYINDQNDSTV